MRYKYIGYHVRYIVVWLIAVVYMTLLVSMYRRIEIMIEICCD